MTTSNIPDMMGNPGMASPMVATTPNKGPAMMTPSKMAKGDKGVTRHPAKKTKTGSSNWIAGAIKHPGALRKTLGAKAGKPIPASKLRAAAKKSGVTGKRARLAITLKGLSRK